MKKLNYILKDLLTDRRENFRIFIFSVVLSFVGLFFFCNTGYVRKHISLLEKLSNSVFITVENADYTYSDVKKITQEYGTLHFVGHTGVLCDETICDAYVYDDYLSDNISYSLKKGKMIENDSQIMISKSLGKIYDIGDMIKVSGYDATGTPIEKEKTVCGILDMDAVYYPTGKGNFIYDMLIVDLDDELYLADAIITIDGAFFSEDDSMGVFTLEPNDQYEGDVLDDLFESIGDVNDGDDVIRANEEHLIYEKNQKKVFVIAGLIIGLSVFLGSIYISVIRRRRELGVMLLAGSDYMGALMLVKMNGLLSAVVGAVVGETASTILMQKGILEGYVSFHYSLAVLLIIVLLYIGATLIIGACWKREHIIDLIMRDI
ncbi:MAG: hypothetical protein NC225_07505 [Clostridium sp.]|nr:hypothetical protein [Clostridium sp.]